MPEVFIQGGEGKLQAKYSPSEEEKPNIAIVLHPNPKHGGTMDSKVNYAAFKVMKEAGFSTLRINFRGVGKSDGAFTEGEGELNDASVSLDWLQKKNEDFRSCWIVGFSFGAPKEKPTIQQDLKSSFFFWSQSRDTLASFNSPSPSVKAPSLLPTPLKFILRVEKPASFITLKAA